MGNKVSAFTAKELQTYEDCTFFTSQDILRIFKRYCQVGKGVLPANLTCQTALTNAVEQKRIYETMPELKENPFREQICKVFSSKDSEVMTFEQFLDMFSVFSEAATLEVKSVYAFKIYDWDGDGFLNESDLEKTLLRLIPESPGGENTTQPSTGQGQSQQKNGQKTEEKESRKKDGLTKEDIVKVVEKVLGEADLDNDKKLSFVEFEHVISRAPDFINTFQIRI